MIETLIFDALREVPVICQYAAYYLNMPAVFYQQSPSDMDEGWNDGIMLPRIIYNINWKNSPERGAVGELIVEVFCTNENQISAEEILKEITENISGLFCTDIGSTYAIKWNESKSFQESQSGKSKNATRVSDTLCIFGAKGHFDIIAFPKQEGVSPCPIWSINSFIRTMQPNCILIGHDKLPKYFRPTAINPAVYVKRKEINQIRSNYAMSWLSMEAEITIVSSDIEQAQIWIDALLRDIFIERETVMKNGSPYLITKAFQSESNFNLDATQITLLGEYGILRKEKEKPKLNNVIFER